ncbi:MAG: hypothetical protein DME59_21435 [Verrucomicrobia bacterium]|nr:MAG: hypothetical protein DME59_21435 [Verrucomicrobiota bacterium]PYL70690.1 MAG: hypothetical protein DMF26_21255 [Verrucomicrobiota bacterium]
MIGYWQIHHSILNYLKEWNEAGVIGAMAAAGTLAAVVVALLPTIKTWWTRPKLVLEIPPNASEVSEQPLEGTGGTVVFAGPRSAPLFTSAYWRAALAIRNTGRTAAVGVRVVITDVYRVTDSGEIATVGFSQRTLPGDGELSSRLVARFLLLSRAKIANHDSGFVFGPLSHAITGNITGMQVRFTPARPDLKEAGNYLLRVVTAASNVRANGPAA